MQVFKTYFKVAKKHLGAFFIYSFIFLVLLNLFVSQKTDNPENFKTSKIKVSVFDHDHSNLSSSLISFIDENHEIVKMDEDIDTIRDKMYIRDVEYVLIIPEGFEKNIISSGNAAASELAQHNTDKSLNENPYQLESFKFPNSVSAIFIQSQINKFINIYSSYMILGYDADTANTKTLETLTLEAKANITASQSEEISVSHVYYTYICYILISSIVLCIAPIIIVFNKDEIKRRTNLSCVSPFKKNLCIAFASLFFMLIILFLFVGISFIMAGNEMTTGIGMVRIFNTFVNAVMCLSFAFLLATFVTNENLLGFITNFFGLASSFLCGIFVDRQFLGKTVLNFSKILPAHWYMNIELELTKYEKLSEFTNSTVKTLTYGFVIQLLFAVAMFAAGMVISKTKKSA